MIELNLLQGTADWHAARAKCFNASEAPAMMGVSPYKTRTALLAEKATGIVPEVDAATQARFNMGHEVEAKARPLIEQIIGEELFPVVATDDSGKYLASSDGATMLINIGMEHKAWNESLAAEVVAGNVPDSHRWQLDQQFLVFGFEKIIFVVSNGTPEKLVHCWYYPQPERIAALLAGWKQFAADLAAYVPAEVIPAAVAAPINDMPALSIEITGNVVASNLVQWKGIVTERIAAINTNLQSDQDFADADKMVKFLDDGEKRIDVVKAQAQSQAVSIDEVFRALDEIKATMRTKRLELDKLVKARKENIRVEIQQGGQKAYAEHCAALNARLKGQYLPGNIIAAFADVMKGKKTVSSLRGAVNDELARVKIESNALADKIDANLKTYGELAAGHEFLFRDLFQIVTQPAESFSAVVSQRISAHVEAKRKEEEATRARIQAEEEAKAAAKLKAEQDRIANEAAAKARADAKAEADRIAAEQKAITGQATVSQNGANSTPVFPNSSSPAEAVAQEPAPVQVVPATQVAASVTAPAVGNIKSAIDRLKQYLGKASFSSESDRYSAIECITEIERFAEVLFGVSPTELQQVAHFVERLASRKAA